MSVLEELTDEVKSVKESKILRKFKEFINRGNVIDLAVAVVIGAAFNRIVTTLVDGIIMPPLGLLLKRVDFTSLFYVLDKSKGVPLSVEEAKTKGIPIIAYGSLINEVVTFMLVALVIFLIVRQVNRFKNKQESGPVTTKDCPRCLSTIPLKATRCAECCADLVPA